MDVQQDGIALAFLEAGRPGDPGLHLGAVLRDRREALGRDQLAATGELAADVGQLPLAGVELGQVGRGRAGADDLPSRTSYPERTISPPATSSGSPPVGGDAVDVDVAAVLDREDDRVAVPDRLADLRVGVARAVERGGQDPPVLAGLGVQDCDLTVSREVEAAGAPFDGEVPAVRGVARRVVLAVAGREPLRLPALGRDDVDVAEQFDVPVLAARGGEGDALRRPASRPGTSPRSRRR